MHITVMHYLNLQASNKQGRQATTTTTSNDNKQQQQRDEQVSAGYTCVGLEHVLGCDYGGCKCSATA